jgi:hypothetical protein
VSIFLNQEELYLTGGKYEKSIANIEFSAKLIIAVEFHSKKMFFSVAFILYRSIFGENKIFVN